MAPDDQYARIERWCAENGHTILQRHDEIDVSGAKMTRPKLDLVLRRIEEGITQGIVVADRSRFARTLGGAIQALEAIDKAGGAFLAADGFDSTTPEGRLGVSIMLSFAQYELERIAGGWQRATSRAVADGVHVAPTPYGYVRPHKRARLEPDPERGPRVTEAFRIRAQGESWGRVCEVLGVARSSAQQIIRNDVYLGIAKGPKGARRPLSHPALTDEETFHRAQPGTRRITGTSKPVGVLRGLVACAGCGRVMSIYGASGYPQYACRGQSSEGRCPAQAAILVSRLDAYVTGLLADRLWKGDPDAWAILQHDQAYEQARQALKQAQAERTAFVLKTSALDPDYDAGLKLRDDAIHAARRKLGELPGPSTSVIGKLESNLNIEDHRAEMRRFVQFVQVSKAGRGRIVPVEARVSVTWR